MPVNQLPPQASGGRRGGIASVAREQRGPSLPGNCTVPCPFYTTQHGPIHTSMSLDAVSTVEVDALAPAAAVRHTPSMERNLVTGLGTPRASRRARADSPVAETLP